MTIQVSAEELKRYQRTARARWQADRKRRSERHSRAWELARRAGALLKSEYSAQRVVAFGSLIHADRFTVWSDVDLAAWGLTSENWLKATSAVKQLGSNEGIELNLVDIECSSPELLKAIQRDGVAL